MVVSKSQFSSVPEFEQYRPEPIDLSPQNPIVNVVDGVSEVQDGAMQSPGFKSGSKGWRLKSDGSIEANSGTFRGQLTAGSIDIPSSSTANSFHTDSSGNSWWGSTLLSTALASITKTGNATVTSLRRKDFHWFTIFESIDGFFKSTAGTGTIVLGSDGVDSATGTVSGNENQITKTCRNAGTTAFTWDKSKSGKYSILIQTDVDNHEAKIGVGSLSVLTERHIGFKIINGVVSGTVANGTTESSLSLRSISNNFVYILEFYYNSEDSSVNFYINGTSWGSITTNIPTGTIESEKIFQWYFKTTAAVSKTMSLSLVDLWQAN